MQNNQNRVKKRMHRGVDYDGRANSFRTGFFHLPRDGVTDRRRAKQLYGEALGRFSRTQCGTYQGQPAPPAGGPLPTSGARPARGPGCISILREFSHNASVRTCMIFLSVEQPPRLQPAGQSLVSSL